jgi:hypothetical protein
MTGIFFSGEINPKYDEARRNPEEVEQLIRIEGAQPGEGADAIADSKKKAPLAGAIFLLVPEAGIEPARPQGPLDFESSASTYFTTPAFDLVLYARLSVLSRDME